MTGRLTAPEGAGKRFVFLCAAITVLSMLLSGCYRGNPSEKTPVHLNPNMDYQPKYQPLEESRFFEDGMAMRSPVEGTVAQGELKDGLFFTGKNSDGAFVEKSPVKVSLEILMRGQNRFNIYCSPCHSRAGDGTGILSGYNYPEVKTLHEQRLRDIEDGHIFDVITNGKDNMPSYKHQVPAADRWAIVMYIRALQRSQNAGLNDIPESQRDRIR